MAAMSTLIDVPAGLNGVAVTDTTIGDVDGEAGFFHYRGHDATDLARHHSFEEVWHLVAVGHLPDDAELAAFRADVAAAGACPTSLLPVLGPLARRPGRRSGASGPPVRSPPTSSGCARSSTSTPPSAPARRCASPPSCPAIVAALHRASLGLDPLDGGDDLGHAAAYLRARHRRDARPGGGTGARAVPDPHHRPRLQRLHVHGARRGLDRRRPRRRRRRRPRRPRRPAARRRAGPGARRPRRHRRPGTHRGVGRGRGRRRPTDHGLRPRRLPHRDPARRCSARSPPARRRPRRPGRRRRGARPRHAAPAQAGPPAAEQRRVLRRRRDGVGRPAPRAVHPDVRRQPHRRLDDPRRRAGRRSAS